MNILVTGGAGYIGSHTVVEMLNAGHNAIIVDNLSNSKPEALRRIEEITGKEPVFYKSDILDKEALKNIFGCHKIDAVIHFAGLKAVGESVKLPLKYYYTNITGTIRLVEVMSEYNVKKLVFSSSATVYGIPDKSPVKEEAPLNAMNPYGRTKLMIEEILRDLYVSDNEWSIALLRYFNPIGAHPSGRIGEDPSGIPNNLMPYITQVAVGKLPNLNVFGNDYPTKDGTCIRDYIHVVDLAKGHLSALDKIMKSTGAEAYNLGTGIGYSVLDIVNAFEKANGLKVPYKFTDRRAGDIAEYFSDPGKALSVLGWKTELTLEDMCRDSWNWQRNNPNGY